ncbi:MAG TPA: hypothetical protein VJ486_10795 [Geothrix sp.]|nr:hypothetical protein [Geothrix sp.]
MILRIGWAVQLISPLIPVVAAGVGYRSTLYIRRPWMNRLSITLLYILLVNWLLLATAMNHIQNNWMYNASVIPEFALSLWTLSGIGPRPIPTFVLGPAPVGILGIAILQWLKMGPWEMWPMVILYSITVLFALCIWRLARIIPLIVEDPDTWQPAFWLLGSWMLMNGVDLAFWPLFDYFLARLSRPLVLVPFLMKFILGMFFNLALARTFLCRKSHSS